MIALAVTREGLPVKSWVFPSNTLARAGGKYLLATRMATVAEIKNEVLSQLGRYTSINDNLQAKEVVIGEEKRRRRYIPCYYPKETERQRLHREEIVRLLEEELFRHRDHSASAGWAIDLLASKRFKCYLTTTKAGKLRLDRAAIKEASRYDGKWVLETNDDTISLDDAALDYKSLLIIERCFRSLKRTQIQMIPMYHWSPRRIETHVKICILALLLERVAELRCGAPWSRISNSLSKLQATEFRTSQYCFFQINQVRKDCREFTGKLAIPLPPSIFGIKLAEKGTAML